LHAFGRGTATTLTVAAGDAGAAVDAVRVGAASAGHRTSSKALAGGVVGEEKAGTVTKGNVHQFRALFQAQTDAACDSTPLRPALRRQLTFQKVAGYHGKVAGLASQLRTLAEEGQIKAGPALPTVRPMAQKQHGSNLRGGGGGSGGGGAGAGGGRGGGVGLLAPAMFGAPPPHLTAARQLSDDVVQLMAKLSLMRSCAGAAVKLGIGQSSDFALFADREMIAADFPQQAVDAIRAELEAQAQQKHSRKHLQKQPNPNNNRW
jgi:hypothetical protein